MSSLFLPLIPSPRLFLQRFLVFHTQLPDFHLSISVERLRTVLCDFGVRACFYYKDVQRGFARLSSILKPLPSSLFSSVMILSVASRYPSSTESPANTDVCCPLRSARLLTDAPALPGAASFSRPCRVPSVWGDVRGTPLPSLPRASHWPFLQMAPVPFCGMA